MKTLIERLEPKTGWTWRSKTLAWVLVIVLILAFAYVWTKVVDWAIPTDHGASAPLSATVQ